MPTRSSAPMPTVFGGNGSNRNRADETKDQEEPASGGVF